MKWLLIINFLMIYTENFLGIDVSYHQEEINWSQVAKEKYFVIIRAGRGRSADVNWEKNYAGAKKAGLKVGAYWYTYASSEKDAEDDAYIILKILKGKKFEWPIYYDIEENSIFQAGIEDIIAHKFCQILENNNYYCGIYSNSANLTVNFKGTAKKTYTVWVAHWHSKKPSYKGKYEVWQTRDNGTCPGIKKGVDEDIGYTDFEKIMKEKGKNGFDKTEIEKQIWNYFINNNCSQFGTSALLGYFFSESGLEYDSYEKDYHEEIGLTDQEYIDQVNNGIYTHFSDDHAGFGLAQWNLNTKKNDLLKKCFGMIGNLNCQLNFIYDEFTKIYIDLWKILKTCTNLRYCIEQILTLYQNTKTYSLEKKNEIYKYSLKYFKKLSKKCTEDQFFSIRNRECVDFFDIPTDCDYITISQAQNITYNISCWKLPHYQCESNYYSYDFDFNTMKNGGCILLNQNEKVPNCINYAKYDYQDYPFCVRCKEDFYCNPNEFHNCNCEIMKEKNEHCTHYEYYEYISRIVCKGCELGYYIMDFNCYKIPAKIENCKLHEEFYTNEVSCLNLEEEEEREREKEGEEELDIESDTKNNSKSLLISYLYSIIFNLLILI